MFSNCLLCGDSDHLFQSYVSHQVITPIATSSVSYVRNGTTSVDSHRRLGPLGAYEVGEKLNTKNPLLIGLSLLSARLI